MLSIDYSETPLNRTPSLPGFFLYQNFLYMEHGIWSSILPFPIQCINNPSKVDISLNWSFCPVQSGFNLERFHWNVQGCDSGRNKCVKEEHFGILLSTFDLKQSSCWHLWWERKFRFCVSSLLRSYLTGVF